MKTDIMRKNETEVAVIYSDEPLITGIQSALDLVMTVKHETGCTNIALNKDAVTDGFFILSTCLAGEILEICQLRHKICYIWRFFKIYQQAFKGLYVRKQ